MRERIREVRKQSRMSQADFGKAIGVSRDTVANIETRVDASDVQIKAICMKFQINEKWLRTGEGDMYNTKSGNDFMLLTSELDLSEFEDDAYMKGLIEDIVKTWMALDKERKKVLIEVAKKIEEERKKRQEINP